MSTAPMPKTSTSYANLHVPERLFSDLSDKSEEVNRFVKSKKNVEFEMRLGKYENGRERSTFVPGVSYEEFSRFYTYAEENYEKVSSENYLDIYSDAVQTRDEKPIRMTITGSGAIMNYCATNMLPPNITFQTKSRLTDHLNIDICDVRLSLSEEKELKIYEMVIGTMDELNKQVYDSGKQFRYKKRMSYLSPDKLFRYDLTQTKQVYSGSNMKVEKKLGESDIFSQQPVYEVEVELVDFSVNLTPKTIIEHMTNIMQIRNNTELVLTNAEKEFILKDFLSLYLNKSNVDREFDEYYNRRDKQYHKMFPGAKVSTLELDNLFKSEKKPYIFADYTVTDKADGERYLLFIDRSNFVFFINDRMEVLRTDIQLAESEKMGSTMLDGELLVKLEKGVQVYHYYAFDMIFNHNEAAYRRDLFPKNGDDRSNSRIGILEDYIQRIKTVQSPVMNGVPYVQINMKNMRSIDGENEKKMTEQCAAIWNNQESFRYELDGLIFTPKFEAYPIGRLWASALKWKPPQENSIDFLIKFRTGESSIQTVLEGETVVKYQLGDLYVGDMVNKSYVEKKFDIPNTISKEPTYLIRVPLNTSGSKDDVIVRDETIVECVWNSGWKVLRTRLDKTQRYLASGKKIGGTANNIAVAISIWSTIVHPITVDMITGVVPLEAGKKSEYYSNVGTSLTEPLRGFNNYMKALLIGGARKSGSSLIDFSCGRGGDIQKWFSSNYERVVGLDYSRTGIESLDPAIGAYGRIESKKRTNSKFAKWVEGVNLFWADTSKMVTASYQNGICNSTQRAVAKKALEMPFDVGMSFFTAHYYFQSPMKIRGFFQNMFDNVKNGGLAIITCFDGLEIFKWLEHLETGQIYSGLVDSKPVWQIKKGYNKHTPFLDNSYNVGLKIDIKFESISDDYLTEYLVHPDYLLKMAEEYGFSLISSTEANEQFGLRSGSALFGDIMEHLDDSDEMRKLRSSELGRIYYNDINNLVNDGKYADLREWNKNNRYFILRKNSVDNTVAKTWRAKLSKYDCEKEYEQEEVVVEVDLSEPVDSAPVQQLEIVDHVASSEDKPKAKRTVSRKKSTNSAEVSDTPAAPVVEVAEQENVLPKKRTLKLKKKEQVVSEEEPVSSEPVSVPEVSADTEPNVNVKKRLSKKKSVVQEEVPAVLEEASAPISVKEVPEPAPAAQSAQANNAPRKKKTLAAGPNVLAMLQKAVAAPSEPTDVTAEITAETQSEVQQAVQTVPVGTKIKISKKLLKK
jgi:SAM-dependent methyltransferase